MTKSCEEMLTVIILGGAATGKKAVAKKMLGQFFFFFSFFLLVMYCFSNKECGSNESEMTQLPWLAYVSNNDVKCCI